MAIDGRLSVETGGALARLPGAFGLLGCRRVHMARLLTRTDTGANDSAHPRNDTAKTYLVAVIGPNHKTVSFSTDEEPGV